MKTDENISKDLLTQLVQWHDKGKHQEIVEKLQSLPETKQSYILTNLLARALNNISRYEEALGLLESIREQGQEDKEWQFRMGYSLFYINGREVESISYFERAIELGDDFPSTYELLFQAKSFLEDESDENNDESAEEFTFTPEAFAQLSLKMRLQPTHRHRIEDALDYMLRSKRWGSISGGGTLITDDGEPEACDIEIDLMEYSETMRNNLLSVLKKLEVAKGSKISYWAADKDANEAKFDLTCPIGDLEGLGIYINKVDLQEEAEEGEGIADVYHSLIDILGNNGALEYSYGENANEVALYFYGEGGYEFMLNKVLPFLKENPLGQKCKTEQIA